MACQANSSKLLLDRRLGSVMLAGLLVGTNFTAIVPVYPSIAYSKGLQPAAIGLILAGMPIGTFLTSPLWGSVLLKIGRIKAMTLSVWLTVSLN